VSSNAEPPGAGPPAGPAAAALEGAEIRRIARALVTPELVVLPVRHHSPACAWHVRQVFGRTPPPSVVLVEGPRSFTPLVPLLADPDARMPVAIYAHAVDRAGAGGGDAGDPGAGERRAAAYYPLCDYSPELVAIREAAARGIETRFVDLDFAEQRLAERRPDEPAVPAVDAGGDGGPGTLQHGRDYARSAHLDLLRRRLGLRDEEELWEHLFETGAAAASLEAHVAGIVAYCRLARLGHGDAELAAEATLAREAEMAWHVRQALEARAAAGDPDAGPVLAVVGGFHAVVLPDLLAAPVERPRVPRDAVEEEVATLVRYSFDRLDRLNGYAAGMTSPAWHQLLWENDTRRARAGLPPSPRSRADATLTVLGDVAARLRQAHGVDLPFPAVQAAYEQALRLAALRGRPGPARDDVLDAVTSCFVKGDVDGDGALVLAVARATLGGRAVGRVPRAAGSPPLVRDVLRRARRQRLKVDDEEPHQAVLDLYRRAAHRATSRLLRGLESLGVPFGVCTAGPDFATGAGVDRLQERWEYSWTISAETALVEASVEGATLPEAVARRFGRRLERVRQDGGAGAVGAAALLVQACTLGLHDRLAEVTGLVTSSVATETGFAAVARSAGTLALLHDAREPLEAWRVPELPGLVATAYRRAVYLAADLAGLDPQQDDVAQESAAGLAGLRELLAGRSGRSGQDDGSGHEGLDAALLDAVVDRLAATCRHPLLAGACTGLAYGAGRLDGEQLAGAVLGRLAAGGPPRRAAAFLRGVLGASREAAWQELPLLRAVHGVLSDWSEAAFVAALPELRLAFAGLTPRETDRVAAAVAGVAGVEDLRIEARYDVGEAEVHANLELTAAVLEALRADGLDGWATGAAAVAGD
jgi:hypothetical protein